MKIAYRFSCLLVGVLSIFPLVCPASEIYKVKDEQGHVTYTNNKQLTAAKRRDATRLNESAFVSIITPRGPAAQAKTENLTPQRPKEPAQPVKHKLDHHNYPAFNQNASIRTRRLGESLQISKNATTPQEKTARESSRHELLGLDREIIQVFDLKIQSF